MGSKREGSPKPFGLPKPLRWSGAFPRLTYLILPKEDKVALTQPEALAPSLGLRLPACARRGLGRKNPGNPRPPPLNQLFL